MQLSDGDVKYINMLYKALMTRQSWRQQEITHIANNSLVPEDKIMEYIRMGIFKIIRTSRFINSLMPTVKCKIFLDESTINYVNKHRKKSMDIHEQSKRREHISEYLRERDPWMGCKLTRGGRKYICPQCHVVNVPCDCTVDSFMLPPTAKVPKKNASKKKWLEFINHFNVK